MLFSAVGAAAAAELRTGPLSCPWVAATSLSLPAPAYDEARGDCTLRGKSAAIASFLSALETIGRDCHSRRDRLWSDLQQKKTALDNQIDALPSPPRWSTAEQMIVPAEIGLGGPPRLPAREGWAYTEQLKRVREQTAEYCRRVDQLPQTLRQQCQTINDVVRAWGGANPSQKTRYHDQLNRSLEATRVMRYEESARYYADVLRAGLENVRNNFSEERIRCAELAHPASDAARRALTDGQNQKIKPVAPKPLGLPKQK